MASGERVNRGQVALLSLCWGLATTGSVIVVSVSALVGYALAPDKALATLPAALMWLSTAAVTLPASFLMRRIGRRGGFMIGALIGALGAAIAAFAVYASDFALLCLGVALIGAYNGFNYYFRFAATEATPVAFHSRAISLVLAGGVVSAFMGPALARWGAGLVPPYLYIGPFVVIVGLAAAIFIAVSFLRIPAPAVPALRGGRPLAGIVCEPAFIVAASGAVVAYGIMILLMTISPLAMVACDLAFEDATFVIQWHVLGMFAPSFVSGHLIRRFGVLNVMIAGGLLLLACIAVAVSGVALGNFWVALTLLGVGWNFLFVGATTLLTQTHTPAERAKTQGLNEFMVYGVAGVCSFLSGSLHYHLGWTMLNLTAIAPVLAVLGATLWLARRRHAACRASAAE